MGMEELELYIGLERVILWNWMY